jgi:hypothetical protein
MRRSGLLARLLGILCGSALALIGAVLPDGAALAQGAQININIAPMILVEPGAETPLPIQVGPEGSLPKNSFIRIRGLPPAAKLSEGHLVAAGSWAVPLSALPSLKVAAPLETGSKSQLTVALVGVDGIVWAETAAAFAVVYASSIPFGREAPSKQTTIANIGPAASGDAPALTGPTPRPSLARPSRPALGAEDQQRAQKLVGKGTEQLRDGDIAGARLYFQRAADIGFAPAAFALAETYDPHELARLGVQGMQPDPAAARQWYERALQLGAPEATQRLQRLGAR